MIGTERLLLRPYEPGDVPAILALSADPDVRRFIGNLPDSEEGAWTRVLRCAGHWSLFGFGTLAVVERASDRVVGEVGAGFFRRGVDPMLDSVPEASWIFSSDVGGRGLAFEAMTGLLRWLAQATPHDRVACLVEPGPAAAAWEVRPDGPLCPAIGPSGSVVTGATSAATAL